MTGRLSNLLSPLALIRLGVLPLLALIVVLVSNDGATAQQTAGPPCKCFVPTPTLTLSDTTPGANPDATASFVIGLGPDGVPRNADDTGDYNFGGVVTFTPPTSFIPTDAEVPDGAITGNLNANSTLGLINSGCNTEIPVSFTYMEATTNISNTIEPLPQGATNQLSPLAGDLNQDGIADIKPPPAVTQYPSYLNAVFDPDWDDAGPDKIAGNADDINGPAPPIQPRSRFAAATPIPSAGNLWVILQTVIFDPGTKLPRLPAFPPELGYMSVTVLQDPAVNPSPGAVSDFCTPLRADTTTFGITQDNPDTPANEGGVPWRKNPDAAGDVTGYLLAFSQRDADGDGYENALDPCPYDPDTEWNARHTPPNGDTDTFAGSPLADGIPNTCDPTPTEATGTQPTDHDGDGFINRGDNCPLDANPDQKDNDTDENGKSPDGIGDACDRNPGTPDTEGARLVCIRAITAHIGGDPNAGVGPCEVGFPGGPALGADPGAGDIGASGPGGDAAGTGTGAGTGAGAGAGAGAGGAAGGAGGPASGIGSLSPVASTVPAWAAIAAGLGTAGLIGSLGTMASRLVKRRRDG
jgi:hypothetical protein